MDRYVDITFDCLPLRSIGRMDIPIDASPKFRARCERIQKALTKHGSLNTYYLYNARCSFHLTNRSEFGVIEFGFEGTVLTDETDTQQVMKACNVDMDALRKTVQKYIDEELMTLVIEDGEDAKPTTGFQRVVQRAVLHAERRTGIGG